MSATIPAHRTRRISSSQWQQHLSLCANAGQSPVSYCAEHNLPIHRFRHWAKRLRMGSGNFVPVVHQASVTPCTLFPAVRHCTFELGKGKRLIIESDAALSEVIRILKRAI